MPAGDAGDVLRGRGGGKRANAPERASAAKTTMHMRIHSQPDHTFKDLVIRDTIHWIPVLFFLSTLKYQRRDIYI